MVTADLGRCFGCGEGNPVGLHLKKTFAGERARIEYDVRPEHCSCPGLMHGGVTCVLLDEVMYHAVAGLGTEAVTVSLSIDYRSPGLAGQHLVCEAWVQGREGRRIEVLATIREAESSAIVAEGRGTFLEVDMARFMERASSRPPAGAGGVQ